MRYEACIFPIDLGETLPPIDISHAAKIEGWMEEMELIWLGKVSQRRHRIVEVGSFMGRSTRIIGENTPGFVLAIDDFEGSRESYISAAWVEWGEKIRPEIYSKFLENCDDLIQARKVIPMRCRHDQIEIDFQPDMVFIDGDHEYENVKRDLEFWKSKLAPGGLLCGHDINIEGVKRAVTEIIGEHHNVSDTCIWIESNV